MNEAVKKVFLIIGTLVLVFILWQLIFASNTGTSGKGILITGYNSIARQVNKSWGKVAGTSDILLAEWTDSTSANIETFNYNITVD